MAINLNNIIETSLPQGYSGFSGYSGVGPGWKLKSSNYTAADTDRIIADTSSGSFTITLPSTPSLGSYVVITDGGDWEINNLTVARNGSTIEGYSEDLLVTIGNMTVELLYSGSTWQVISTVGVQGPSDIIKATNNSNAGQLYPVMVAAAGSDQTPIVSTNQFSFNTLTGVFSLNGVPVNGSITLDDISSQFNGIRSVFPLMIENSLVTNLTNSNIQVMINGSILKPYTEEIRYPWMTPYDSYSGYRIVGSDLILYNAPAPNDEAVVSIINRSSEESQAKRYPYSATSIALGD